MVLAVGLELVGIQEVRAVVKELVEELVGELVQVRVLAQVLVENREQVRVVVLEQLVQV